MIGLQRIEIAAVRRSAFLPVPKLFPGSKAEPQTFRLEVERPDRLEKAAVSIVGSNAEFDDQTRLMRLDDPHRKRNVFQCRRGGDTTNRIVQFDARAHDS